MSVVKKGSWVQIESILLNPEERSPNLPEETKKVSLKLWVKGYLQEDADIGEEVVVKTIIGRKVTGKLIAENPKYKHDFGRPIPELFSVGKEFRKIINGGAE